MTNEVQSSAWQERVGAFATAVGKTIEEVSGALAPICGQEGEQALAVLADSTAAPDNELIEALSGGSLGVARGVVRMNISLLRGPQQPAVTLAPDGRMPSFDVLPSPPDDESFLAMLKTGGELKVGQLEVLSAVKASLASRVGLFDLPTVLVEKMEDFALSQEDPCSSKFYELQRIVVQRNYADVLNAIGVDGRFVSATRKNNFLNRINETLWSSLATFNEQLKGWQESWTAGMSNPGILIAALTLGQAGAAMLPPGMMQPPETGGIRDAAEGVIDKINKVFAGMGIPIARALAYDASRIKQVLEDPALPMAIGAANKDQMLKTLGLSVAADYVRLERNITRFTLSVMELPKVSAGPGEYQYLGAMIMLGSQIPWNNVMQTITPALVGGRSRTRKGNDPFNSEEDR